MFPLALLIFFSSGFAALLYLRRFGFEATVSIGAALNLLAACGALLLIPFVLQRASAHAVDPLAEVIVEERSGPGTYFPPRIWIAIYGTSGLIALSMEILWFRA